MERKRDAAHRKKELAKLARMADDARCLVCGKPVSVEDRCSDGNYLHRECAFGSQTRFEQQH